MRVVIDIPDSDYRKIETIAGIQGIAPETWILNALESQFQKAEKPSAENRIELPLVVSKEGSYKLDSESLAQIIDEDDRESLN